VIENAVFRYGGGSEYLNPCSILLRQASPIFRDVVVDLGDGCGFYVEGLGSAPVFERVEVSDHLGAGIEFYSDGNDSTAPPAGRRLTIPAGG